MLFYWNTFSLGFDFYIIIISDISFYYISDSICNLLRVTRPLTRLVPNISALFPFIPSISCSIQFRPCSNAPRHTGVLVYLLQCNISVLLLVLLRIAISWYKLLDKCSAACNSRIISWLTSFPDFLKTRLKFFQVLNPVCLAVTSSLNARNYSVFRKISVTHSICVEIIRTWPAYQQKLSSSSQFVTQSILLKHFFNFLITFSNNIGDNPSHWPTLILTSKYQITHLGALHLVLASVYLTRDSIFLSPVLKSFKMLKIF